jgi:hypothetical protein
MCEVHRPGSNVEVYFDRREMPSPEQWIGALVAWLPVYVEGCGNATRVVLKNGREQCLPVTAGWLYQRVAAHYMWDPGEVRQWYYRCMRLTQSPPLTVPARGLSFFAVKARTQTYGRNDGVMGYVSDAHIHRIDPVSSREITVHLTTGNALRLCMSRPMFEWHRTRARVFRHYLASEGLIRC